MTTRRDFLLGASTLAAAATLGRTTEAAASASSKITPKAGTAKLLGPEGGSTKIWGYDGLVPGPILRAKQGEEFAVDLVNQLPQPTTIHWHGIRIKYAMDSVAGLTQPPVKPGDQFTYRFVPPDAGTYWYHPHNRTWEQLARGLHGAFIVGEQNPPQVDQDVTLIVDDWRLDEDDQIHERSLGSMHDVTHAGRLGNVVTLNGQDTFDLAVKAGERLRVRLINAANARTIGLIFEGHAPIVVALDGQPLKVPFAPQRNMVFLAPSQRADIILDCNQTPGSKTKITADTGREKLQMGQVVYHSSKRVRPSTLSDIPVLPSNPMPTTLDLDNSLSLDLVMTGGAMSWFEAANYKGKTIGVRELVRKHGKAWAFNGTVGMPEQPLAKVKSGQTVKVRLVNQTAWPHAMHFHGHHFREIEHSRREPLPYWRDTIFIQREEEITVAFHAHNPGKWMLHCHMLGHQAGGMGTWYEVS
ncbi:MAG: multicopper oxidase family protein [Hyphomicrobiaceae bacterium TMED74]|nr:copper oxidase [Filomicrobium sp.]RPG35565.1 MAG: multicopper oxidase family protein [Hyphomicrobiaceae bacterium TMED74]